MLTLQSRRNNGNCLNKIKDALTRSFLPPIISSISRLCLYHVLGGWCCVGVVVQSPILRQPPDQRSTTTHRLHQRHHITPTQPRTRITKQTNKTTKKRWVGCPCAPQAHTTPHPPMKFEVINAGSNLLSHTLPGAVPSAPTDLATGFEKDNRA